VSRTVAGWAPGCTSICQSMLTLRIARAVIEDWAAAKKLPRHATSATAAATPATVAATLPHRRRTNPTVHLAITSHLDRRLGG